MRKTTIAALCACFAVGLACKPDGEPDCKDVESAECIEGNPRIGGGGVVIPFPTADKKGNPYPKTPPEPPGVDKDNDERIAYISVKYNPASSKEIVYSAEFKKNFDVEDLGTQSLWLNEWRDVNVGDRVKLTVKRINNAPGEMQCSIVIVQSGKPLQRVGDISEEPEEDCDTNTLKVL